MADRIENSLESLSLMLNTLLDLAKLDAGKITAECTPVEADALLAWIEEEFREQFRAKGFVLDFFRCRRRLVLNTDLTLLKGVLRNLLVNALKYTEKGKVLVALKQQGARAVIQVWDTGIGIAPDHMKHIFEEFFQVGNEERDSSKGLGLGLAIVAQQAKLIGARVGCRSRLGRGTVSMFRYPWPSAWPGHWLSPMHPA